MESHPYYEAPEEDQGREERTNDWTKSEIISFLDEQYDDPLDEFGVDNYEELEARIEGRGLNYDEDSDWRYDQVPDLGEKDFDYESASALVRADKLDEIENPEPREVKLSDESGEVQVHWENK